MVLLKLAKHFLATNWRFMSVMSLISSCVLSLINFGERVRRLCEQLLGAVVKFTLGQMKRFLKLGNLSVYRIAWSTRHSCQLNIIFVSIIIIHGLKRSGSDDFDGIRGSATFIIQWASADSHPYVRGDRSEINSCWILICWLFFHVLGFPQESCLGWTAIKTENSSTGIRSF